MPSKDALDLGELLPAVLSQIAWLVRVKGRTGGVETQNLEALEWFWHRQSKESLEGPEEPDFLSARSCLEFILCVSKNHFCFVAGSLDKEKF